MADCLSLRPRYPYCHTLADRRQFLRGVYGMLAVMLFVVVLIIIIVTYVPVLHSEIEKWASFYIILSIFVGFYMFLLFCEACRRCQPIQYIALVIFTLLMGVFLGSATARFATIEILYVTIGCFGVAVLLACYAACCRLPMVNQNLYAYILLITFIVGISVLLHTWYHTHNMEKTLTVLMFVLIILLFAIYVIYDMSLMLSSKCGAICPDEYIYGALSLWTDILNPLRQLVCFYEQWLHCCFWNCCCCTGCCRYSQSFGECSPDECPTIVIREY